MLIKLILGLLLLAIVLDWLFMRALKNHYQRHPIPSQGQARYIFGRYSPVLTWLGGSRLLRGMAFLTPAIEPIRTPVTKFSKAAMQSTTRWIEANQVALIWTYVSLVLILAAIPPLLVVQDRWLGDSRMANYLIEATCRYGILCNSSYPAYFLIIFPALLALLILYLTIGDLFPLNILPDRSSRPQEPTPPILSKAGRRMVGLGVLGSLIVVAGSLLANRVPGWELALAILVILAGLFLQETSLHTLRQAWETHRAWLLAFFLAHIALILYLDELYSSLEFSLLYTLLLVITTFNLLRYLRQVPLILWIFSLAVILYITNINAWWLSAIGDEYEFYNWGRLIVHNISLSDTAANLFSRSGAYGTHPFLSSVLQAISMALLGSNGFGWRFSSLYLSALSILFLFGFLKTFVARRLALTACLLLAFSHYVMSFGKIGYNNLQALFGLSLVLWASARAYRMKSTFAYATLGVVTGFCFYLYPAALYAVPIPFLFLLFYDPPVTKKAIGRWILVVACALLLIFPLFLQAEYWQSKIQGTFFYSSELTHSLEKLIHHFYLTYVFAFFSYLFTPEEGHFIAVSYADPLSGVFISIGILMLLRSWRKERFAAFWVLSFLAMVFFAGASHDRQFPPSTRMFLVLPWFVLFAACGLWWVITQLRKLSGIGSLSGWMLPVVFPVILGLSLYQAYPLARDRMTGFQSLETLFLRTVQRAQTVYPDSAQTFVFITDPTWGSTPIHKLPQYYPLRAKFGEVVVEGQILPESAYPLLTQPDTFIIIKPWFEEEWKAALGEGLLGLGKVPCDILTTNGYPRFQLWHTPGMDGLCG